MFRAFSRVFGKVFGGINRNSESANTSPQKLETTRNLLVVSTLDQFSFALETNMLTAPLALQSGTIYQLKSKSKMHNPEEYADELCQYAIELLEKDDAKVFRDNHSINLPIDQLRRVFKTDEFNPLKLRTRIQISVLETHLSYWEQKKYNSIEEEQNFLSNKIAISEKLASLYSIHLENNRKIFPVRERLNSFESIKTANNAILKYRNKRKPPQPIALQELNADIEAVKENIKQYQQLIKVDNLESVKEFYKQLAEKYKELARLYHIKLRQLAHTDNISEIKANMFSLTDAKERMKRFKGLSRIDEKSETLAEKHNKDLKKQQLILNQCLHLADSEKLFEHTDTFFQQLNEIMNSNLKNKELEVLKLLAMFYKQCNNPEDYYDRLCSAFEKLDRSILKKLHTDFMVWPYSNWAKTAIGFVTAVAIAGDQNYAIGMAEDIDPKAAHPAYYSIFTLIAGVTNMAAEALNRKEPDTRYDSIGIADYPDQLDSNKIPESFQNYPGFKEFLEDQARSFARIQAENQSNSSVALSV